MAKFGRTKSLAVQAPRRIWRQCNRRQAWPAVPCRAAIVRATAHMHREETRDGGRWKRHAVGARSNEDA